MMMGATSSWQEQGGVVPARHSEGDRGYIWLGNFVLALSIVGYSLPASISQIFGLVSNEINLIFRWIVIGIALLLMLLTVARKQFRVDALVGLFFLLYAFRLLSDLNNSLLPNIARDSQFFVATVLIPTMAVAGGAAWYEEKTCLRFLTVIGGIGGALILYSLATTTVSTTQSSVVDRAGFQFLNPISIGYHGLFTAAAAITLLVRYRSRIALLICTPIAVIGGYLMIVAGTRGPFVALMVALLITGAANKNATLTYVLLGAVAAGVLTYYGVPELILTRFLEIGQDLSSMERVYALQMAIDEAIEHPLFGYAYIEPVTGFYPHNLLVESALALGIGGVALMLWMQVSLVWNAWQTARRGEWLMPFLAATMFANAWISGSLWGSGLFFMVVWLVRDHRARLPQTDRSLNASLRQTRA